MKVTQEVVISWAAKLTPMVLLALTTKGCVTQEQADQITPLVSQVVQWLYAGGFLVSTVYTLYRSLKSHGSK